MFPYRIVTAWSDEDACYVARVPTLGYCAAHGDSPEEATREVQVGARMMLDVLGASAPAPDTIGVRANAMSPSLEPSLRSAHVNPSSPSL